MKRDKLQKLLAKLGFAAPLSAPTRAALAAVADVVEFAEGTCIFTEGSQHAQFYLLVSGRVALEMNVPARGSVRILSLEAGDLLAWSALLGSGTMTATAWAIEPSTAIVVSADELSRLCEHDPRSGFEIMRQVASALSRRLLATRLQLLDLFEPSSTTDRYQDFSAQEE